MLERGDEDRSEPEGEAFASLVKLYSSPYLRSDALGSEGKYEI